MFKRIVGLVLAVVTALSASLVVFAHENPSLPYKADDGVLYILDKEEDCD